MAAGCERRVQSGLPLRQGSVLSADEEWLTGDMRGEAHRLVKLKRIKDCGGAVVGLRLSMLSNLALPLPA